MATKKSTNNTNKKNKRIILFSLEIIVLLLVVVVLYFTTKTEKVVKYEIKEEELVFNEEVKNNESLQGYRNIALFGVDSTVGDLTSKTRSDTIMVASINEDTHEVKIVSVYRDTYLNIGDDNYNKANAAYSYGGPSQAIKMLNANLDLNITDFVTVGFGGMVDTVDMLGGIMLDITDAEIGYLNDYQFCIAENLNRDYTPITEAGYQLVDGLQATAYCRIRYTAGDDFKRAERQRDVIMAIAEKAKQANAATINNIADVVFPQVATSLGLNEILTLLGGITEYSIVADTGFPAEDQRTTGDIDVGSSVLAVDLVSNVQTLHEFLFGEVDYQVSTNVQSYSDTIDGLIAPYMN